MLPLYVKNTGSDPVSTNVMTYIPPPCSDPLRIVHVGSSYLVVDKPAGLLSVPGRVVKDCVLARVQGDFPGATIVHRLDLDTSGLMVLALTPRATSEINRQFRERLIRKKYVALVAGSINADTGEITLALSPDPDNRPRQRIDPDGKPALTRYEVQIRLQINGRTITRLALVPVTGRSHQLRLHLAAVGHPILGCDLYADDEALGMSDRLCLHASELAFAEPGGGHVSFSSPVPFRQDRLTPLEV